MKKIILFLLIAVSVFGQYKQSTQGLGVDLVFREVFNDETTTRANGASSLTAITYSNGTAVLNGTTSNVVFPDRVCPKIGNSSFTVEGRIKINAYSNYAGLLIDKGGYNRTGYFICQDANGVISAQVRNKAGTNVSTLTSTVLSVGVWYHIVAVINLTEKVHIYINGVEASYSTQPSLASLGSVASTDNMYMGSSHNASGDPSAFANSSYDYINIYNVAKSASEIANLYSGVAFKEVPTSSSTLINFDSRLSARELTGKVLTNSNVVLKRQGSFWTSLFNGTTSYYSIPTVDLSGNITICAWVKANSFGENVLGNILSNSKETLRINSTNSLVNFSRDGASTNASSATSSVVLNKSIFVVITSTSAGVTNIYLGDKNNPPTISGTANQSAGTPSASSTLYIGNRAAGDRTWNGTISKIRIENSILTQNQISQIWSSGRIE